MPALFAFGQHDGLAEGARHLHPDDFVLAYFDGFYMRTTRERAGTAFHAVTTAVQERAGVHTNTSKLRVWSRAGGPPPPGFTAEHWTADRDDAENGVRILGTPLGTPAHAAAHAAERLAA